jgi:hypothetical protein
MVIYTNGHPIHVTASYFTTIGELKRKIRERTLIPESELIIKTTTRILLDLEILGDLPKPFLLFCVLRVIPVEDAKPQGALFTCPPLPVRVE